MRFVHLLLAALPLSSLAVAGCKKDEGDSKSRAAQDRDDDDDDDDEERSKSKRDRKEEPVNTRPAVPFDASLVTSEAQKVLAMSLRTSSGKTKDGGSCLVYRDKSDVVRRAQLGGDGPIQEFTYDSRGQLILYHLNDTRGHKEWAYFQDGVYKLNQVQKGKDAKVETGPVDFAVGKTFQAIGQACIDATK